MPVNGHIELVYIIASECILLRYHPLYCILMLPAVVLPCVCPVHVRRCIILVPLLPAWCLLWRYVASHLRGASRGRHLVHAGSDLTDTRGHFDVRIVSV